MVSAGDGRRSLGGKLGGISSKNVEEVVFSRQVRRRRAIVCGR